MMTKNTGIYDDIKLRPEYQKGRNDAIDLFLEGESHAVMPHALDMLEENDSKWSTSHKIGFMDFIQEVIESWIEIETEVFKNG